MEPMWCGAWWFELLVLGRRYAYGWCRYVTAEFLRNIVTRILPGQCLGLEPPMHVRGGEGEQKTKVGSGRLEEGRVVRDDEGIVPSGLQPAAR